MEKSKILMPEVPTIQEWLQKVRDFITARHAAYLYTEKDPLTGEIYYPKCKNINFYLSDVEAIINKLEIRLKDYLNDPLSFETEKLAIYEEIGKKLDKYFITDDYWEVKTLSELEEEFGTEEK